MVSLGVRGAPFRSMGVRPITSGAAASEMVATHNGSCVSASAESPMLRHSWGTLESNVVNHVATPTAGNKTTARE
jgi:hypothetical protein